MFYLCRTHPTFTLLLISCKNKKPTHKDASLLKGNSKTRVPILKQSTSQSRISILTCSTPMATPPPAHQHQSAREAWRSRTCVLSSAPLREFLCLCWRYGSALLLISSASGVGSVAVFPACVSGDLVMYTVFWGGEWSAGAGLLPPRCVLFILG